jgi:hypothetical protein
VRGIDEARAATPQEDDMTLVMLEVREP